MIKTFQCKQTDKIWQGQASRSFPPDIQNRALNKLRQLDAAISLNDLRLPPSNHLEALKGERNGQWSIRINGQWRICFEWDDGAACAVEIVDYH